MQKFKKKNRCMGGCMITEEDKQNQCFFNKKIFHYSKKPLNF